MKESPETNQPKYETLIIKVFKKVTTTTNNSNNRIYVIMQC